MRYACLVYVDADALDALADVEWTRLDVHAAAWDEDLREDGRLVMSARLESARTATTMRSREGRPFAIDGPATEAARHLSRILVIEARDLNEAMRIAAGHPAVRSGSIEIRPVRGCGGNAMRQGG